jgi:hypothetical protein
VQHADPVTGARVVTLGVPLETIGPPDVRARLLRQCVDLLLADRPLRAPRTAPLGQATALSVAWPDEAGRPYFVVCSDAYTPGIVLPNGGLLPLAPSFLIEASLQPSSPLFASFHGVLPANGAAQPVLFVPGLPFLSGWPLYFAGFTLDATGAAEHALTNWVRVVLH